MSDLRAPLEAALSNVYRVERELGSGGMAVVWLAHDLRHRRRVALKVLRPELSAVMGRERFLREIETLANLTHPHILPLHDSGEAEGLLYYVMPYVEGESLRDRLMRERQLPIDDALRIAREVADALSHAHAHGIVHRDIKPENILLTGNHALVADFGIATAVDAAGGNRLTGTGIAVGTPAYMSPEQALGERTIDARSDIYALGCVLFEMIVGEPPFNGPTTQVMLARRLHEPVPSLRAVRELVPEAIDRAVTRALAKVPADRFATAANFAEALALHPPSISSSGETATSGERRFESPVAASQPISRKFRLGRTAVVVGGAVLATLASLVVWRSSSRSGGGVTSDRVAVARFENRTAIDSLNALGAILADIVSNGLARTGVVNVVPTASVMDASANMSRNRLSFDAKNLGRETNAGVIVYGSYFLRGDSLAIQPQIVDGSGDRVLFPIDLVVVALSDQMAGIHAVLQRVMVTLSSRGNPLLGKAAALAELPKSMEAYRAYIAGFESYFGADHERARAHFYRAVTLDSTFVTALTWAAIVEWTLSANVPKVDSLLKIVERRRGGLLPFDLASLDYLRAWVDGDVEGAQVAARRRAAVGGEGWRIFAVQGALRLNRIDEAYDHIREVMKSPRSLSISTAWVYFADVLHARGEHDRELREVRRGIARIGDRSDLVAAELRALAALGRLGEIRARVETAKSSNVSAAPPGGYQAAIMHLRSHGFRAQADSLARDAVKWYRRSAGESRTWRSRFDLAASLFEVGDSEADTIFAALVNEEIPSPYGMEHFYGLDAAALGYLGVSAAARGDTINAERVIARLESFQRPYLLGANTHWQARIAAQRGQCERTVQYLRAALKSGSAYIQSPQGFLRETPQFAGLSCDAYKEFMKPKK